MSAELAVMSFQWAILAMDQSNRSSLMIEIMLNEKPGLNFAYFSSTQP